MSLQSPHNCTPWWIEQGHRTVVCIGGWNHEWQNQCHGRQKQSMLQNNFRIRVPCSHGSFCNGRARHLMMMIMMAIMMMIIIMNNLPGPYQPEPELRALQVMSAQSTQVGADVSNQASYGGMGSAGIFASGESGLPNGVRAVGVLL